MVSIIAAVLIAPAAYAQSSNQLLVNFGVGAAEIDRSDIYGYTAGFGYRHVRDNDFIVETEIVSLTVDPLDLGQGYRLGLPAAGVRYLAFADSGPSVSLGFLVGLAYTDAPGYTNFQADVRLSVVGDLAKDPTKFHPNLELLAIVPFWTSEPDLRYEFGDLPGTLIARLGLVFPRGGKGSKPSEPDPEPKVEDEPKPVVPVSPTPTPLAVPEQPSEPPEPEPEDLVGGPDGDCERQHPEASDALLQCRRTKLAEWRAQRPAMRVAAVSPEVAATMSANPLNSYWWYVPRPARFGVASFDIVSKAIARLHATVTLVDYALYLAEEGRDAEVAAFAGPLNDVLVEQLEGSEELAQAVAQLPADAVELVRRDPLGKGRRAIPFAAEIAERYRIIALRADAAPARFAELAAREYVQARQEAVESEPVAPPPVE